MSAKGEANRFDRVDAENDPAYFVKFLDARKSIAEDATIKRHMVDLLQPLAGRRVIDVGCGTGDDSRVIAGLVGLEGQVVGVDYSATMVAEARRRTTDAGLPVEFREGDAMKLDFADASFDGCRAERVLMHLSDPRKGLQEMIRIVRSGGRVVASELDQETIFFDSPYVELTRRFVASFADATPSARVGRSLARLMREAGLQSVIGQATVIRVPFGMVRIGFEGHVDKCVQQRLISPQDAERWWQHLKESDAAGEFHCGAIVFTAAGEKR
jgi:ubiquinone/menaquinone biosynthesis C-methylase UbiE